MPKTQYRDGLKYGSPGFSNIESISCLLLSATSQENATLSPNFHRTWNHTLAHPCRQGYIRIVDPIIIYFYLSDQWSCQIDDLRCDSGTPVCIFSDAVCDEIVDCMDGTDEKHELCGKCYES